MTRKDAWSEEELQVLYDFVNDADWFDQAKEWLPFRSENAIRTKMSNLRAEAGIVPKTGPRAMGSSKRFEADAKRANDKYLAALLEMVA